VSTSEAFDLHEHYPVEMAKPEVARICAHYAGIDTMALHGGRPDDSADGQLVYGDTPSPVMYRLFKRWGLGPTDCFYDLGCGCGTVVFTAGLLARRAIGVDLVPRVIDFCQRSAGVLKAANVEFRQADILTTDLSDANFLYIACTTFPKEFRLQLRKKLAECAPGTKIVSVTHPLDGGSIKHIAEVPLIFSWNGTGDGFPFHFHYHVKA
jgi:SAM-dependent methyltransferase